MGDLAFGQVLTNRHEANKIVLYILDQIHVLRVLPYWSAGKRQWARP